VIIGAMTIQPLLFGDFFKGIIRVADQHPAMAALAKNFHGWGGMGVHAFVTLPFWLMIAGVAAAYYCYMINPALPAAVQKRFSGIHTLLDNKYYMDRFNEIVFAGGSRALGKGLWKIGDQSLIDGAAVNGSARLVGWLSGVVRQMQTGYVYHYAIAMILGVAVLLLWVTPLIKR
jgi:NADH-quinone oxidoreductase subunit L